ncbi:MAG: amidase family protein, partial [Leadbetterella sp.]
NENSAFGPTRNFADPTRVPGGSSGASAVAIQAGMCHVSIGSDTGGSVRQPGAFCGIVGIKPQYGRISRWGLAAYASSFDCVGPMGICVDDVALVLDVMAGPDTYDSTAIQITTEKFDNVKPISTSKTLGYFEEAIDSPGLDPEIKQATLQAFDNLKKQGHKIVKLSFPEMKFLLPTYYVLTMAEASSNLSRYDGIRFGYRNKEAKNLNDLYKKTRAEGFGKEVKKRILLGSFILSADYYDAYYLKALKVRNLIRQKTENFFKEVDFIISPTTPSVAFEIGQKIDDPIQKVLADVYTVHANVVGNPAISIPLTKNSENLPIGIQLLGKTEGEKALLEMAKTIELMQF